MIAMVENHVEREGRKSSERRYYLSSVKLDAQAFAAAVRAHWGIENRLHWVLDVVFHDDLTRLRTGSGPQNMAVVKHIAMNLVRNPNDKHSLKVRRKRANHDPDYIDTLVTPRKPLIRSDSPGLTDTGKIGRASCRERLCQDVQNQSVPAPLN